jgi:Ras family protein T1
MCVGFYCLFTLSHGELTYHTIAAAPDGVDDTKGINLKGFLALQHLLLLKGRLETIWAVLRQFGYDDTVHLRKEFIEPDISMSI